MRQALALAALGEGRVEPNPQVGCVIAHGVEVVGEGFHQSFGGPHAEVHALATAGERARGATAYVTLEPCCHFGKTPPCSTALIQAGISRVVAAQRDPFPRVAGGGFAQLEAAGIGVEIGLLEAEAKHLNAPYLHLLKSGRPWVIAKWAMTLDGKLATASGDSRWISGEASRAVVHQIRGRVDAILVGGETARRDDPLLTARPPGPRTATRIVFTPSANLPLDGQLVRTARDIPTLIACGPAADSEACEKLRAAGCEVMQLAAAAPHDGLRELMQELGKRRMTNLLVEGGGRLLGTCFRFCLVNEVHAFIAPKLIGGTDAPTPWDDIGRPLMSEALQLESFQSERLGDDLYLRGRLPSEN